ncbi:MAG: hypothetical protein MUE72_11560 [Chitinophagaceae bacterium]|nr:hypothetical protein [Chitinophagaceae bacterium]
MTFQSSEGNIKVIQEPVIKKQLVPVNEIPIFDSDGKIISSHISVQNVGEKELLDFVTGINQV